MKFIYKMLLTLASQVNKANVKMQNTDKPHKITDDNQSINNGVINEKSTSGMRSPSKTGTKRRRRSEEHTSELQSH